MPGIFRDGINEYLNSLLPSSDPVLAEMEQFADKTGFPIVGPQVGRVLFQISRLRKPESILELGSGFGYSAYWLGKGAPQAKIVCTERSEDNIRRAKTWFHRSGMEKSVTFFRGEALEILSNLGGIYDIVLNDVDKHQYPQIFHTALQHLSADGVLITDNVLWSGTVVDEAENDANTNGIREYNRLIFNSPEVLSSILPIRDGLAVSLKLG